MGIGSRLNSMEIGDKLAKQRVERRLHRRLSAGEIERLLSVRKERDWLVMRWWVWMEVRRSQRDDAGLIADGVSVMSIERAVADYAARRSIVKELNLPMTWGWSTGKGEKVLFEISHHAYREYLEHFGNFPEWRHLAEDLSRQWDREGEEE